MKLHIFSDLHIEFAQFEPPKTNAGDIHIGEKGFDWAFQKPGGYLCPGQP